MDVAVVSVVGIVGVVCKSGKLCRLWETRKNLWAKVCPWIFQWFSMDGRPDFPQVHNAHGIWQKEGVSGH